MGPAPPTKCRATPRPYYYLHRAIGRDKWRYCQIISRYCIFYFRPWPYTVCLSCSGAPRLAPPRHAAPHRTAWLACGNNYYSAANPQRPPGARSSACRPCWPRSPCWPRWRGTLSGSRADFLTDLFPIGQATRFPVEKSDLCGQISGYQTLATRQSTLLRRRGRGAEGGQSVSLLSHSLCTRTEVRCCAVERASLSEIIL